MRDFTILPIADLARMAAFIDGEGHIAIKARDCHAGTDGLSRGPRFWLDLRVANTDLRLPHWCQRTFGGHVYVQSKREGRKALYSWAAIDGVAVEVLRACLPYFVIKAEQARIAIIFRETFSKRSVTVGRKDGRVTRRTDPDVIAGRAMLRQQLQGLYARGPARVN